MLDSFGIADFHVGNVAHAVSSLSNSIGDRLRAFNTFENPFFKLKY